VVRILSKEVDAVQNAAVSAVLLWRFSVSYAAAKGTLGTVPLPALFVVLPLLFDEESAQMVSSTLAKSGLRRFAGKFVESAHAKTDVLLSIERRARELRGQSLEALSLAIGTRLLLLDTSTAEVLPLSAAAPLSLPESVRPLLRNAEKLGHWCGGVSLFELSSILRVTF
jgi:hypothetical protein